MNTKKWISILLRIALSAMLFTGFVGDVHAQADPDFTPADRALAAGESVQRPFPVDALAEEDGPVVEIAEFVPPQVEADPAAAEAAPADLTEGDVAEFVVTAHDATGPLPEAADIPAANAHRVFLPLVQTQGETQAAEPGGDTVNAASAGSATSASTQAQGDFNGDGYDDLVIGVPGEDFVGASGTMIWDAGYVHVLYGSASKLTTAGNQIWHQDTPGILGVAQNYEQFSRGGLTVGDFNGDGYDDLAVGVPGENVGSASWAGAVNVIYGSAAGLTTTGNQLWHQNTYQMAGVAESNDRFGSALTTGDFNADGYADLAVGVPGEDIGSVIDAGAVNVIYGSASGLTYAGNQVWSQDTYGIIDTAESYDKFGHALAAGNFDGEGGDDLAIGVPYESVGDDFRAGAVNIIRGVAGSGLEYNRNGILHQDSYGILGVVESHDYFGDALAAGDFDADSYDDLAIGVPGEDLYTTSDIIDVGVVNVIYGSTSGLHYTGNQVWHQDVSGIGGAIEAGDRFGSALATGDFDANGYADLAVGVPAEAIGSISGAGAVNVIYGTHQGLHANGDRLWYQGLPGVGTGSQTGDYFGERLFVGDFNGDEQDDLVVSIPLKDLGAATNAGAAIVIYHVGNEFSTQYWHQDANGLPSEAESHDWFSAIHF